MHYTWLHFIFNYNLSETGTFRHNQWVKWDQSHSEPQITANLVIWLESNLPVNINHKPDVGPLIVCNGYSEIASYQLMFWRNAHRFSQGFVRIVSTWVLCLEAALLLLNWYLSNTCARVVVLELIVSVLQPSLRMWLFVLLNSDLVCVCAPVWFWLLMRCQKSSGWGWAATPWPPSEIRSEALSGHPPLPLLLLPSSVIHADSLLWFHRCC